VDEARRVLRLIPRLHRWATLTLQADGLGQDLSLRQLGLLFLVREGMTSPGDLARRLRVTPAVITGLLDRLERQGYAQRVDAPDDRRRLRVALTDSGLEISRRVDQLLAEKLAAELAGVSDADLAGLGAALGAVERAVGVLEARAGALQPGDLEMELDEGALGGRRQCRHQRREPPKGSRRAVSPRRSRPST
jgi:DNA-binding MarR family transcriptional regulator